ncbi:hypothetical protein PMA3_26060 [Pseudomonas silesiensis]|uniref:Uncharacterized protein n=1 Tax=Pseudomonas silesiensis TaxID=1853130 RepID=A0A191Z0H1_9PSED|nr:hypothetical protein PMA3_26060 [Pseudomonas silesiensis]
MRLSRDRFWPILLKKSAIISTAEKYALEIEILTLSRAFRAQISRSCAQKRRFQQSVRGRSGRIDFFNRIGRWLPVDVSGAAFSEVSLLKAQPYYWQITQVP